MRFTPIDEIRAGRPPLVKKKLCAARPKAREWSSTGRCENQRLSFSFPSRPPNQIQVTTKQKST